MQNLFKLLTASTAVVLCLTACGQESTGPATTQNDTSTNSSGIQTDLANISVNIEALATAVDAKHIEIKGSTNLPDETQLNITVEDSKEEWRSQTDAIVSNGAFLIPNLEIAYGLSPDRYKIDITQIVPPLQPESVRKVIGDHGERLTGELVSDSSMGKTAQLAIYLTQGSNAEISAAKKEEDRKVLMVTDKIKGMISKGLAMERYRTAESLYSSGKCVELMRANQAIAKSIREEADQLKFEYGHIRVGAMELRECLSCLNTAKDACKRASEALAEQSVNEARVN